MKSRYHTTRAILLGAVLVVVMVIYSLKLMQMQIVEGADYVSLVEQGSTKVQTVSAARGESLDRYGRPLAVTIPSWILYLTRAFCPTTGKQIILDRLDFLNNLRNLDRQPPGDQTVPFECSPDSQSNFDQLKATSAWCVCHGGRCDALAVQKYSLGKLRYPYPANSGRGRYEMMRLAFSMEQPFTSRRLSRFETASKLRKKLKFPGVDIVSTSVREYVSAQSPQYHRTGSAILPDEYPDLNEQGYKINDMIGNDGIEKAYESQTRARLVRAPSCWKTLQVVVSECRRRAGQYVVLPSTVP
jgi:penicillin-binding protein 2